MTYRWKNTILLLAGATLLFTAVDSRADWLVTVDGHRVETRGAWRVEGETVLFDLPTGGLVSMRLAEVDLKASREATESSGQVAEVDPQAALAPVRRESVFRLTDADVKHVSDDEESPAESESALEAGDAEASPQGKNLVVTDWSDDTDPVGDGVLLGGTVRNQGADTSGNVRVVVRLYDVDGAFLASADAELSTTALPPGEAARFRAEFPGLFSFAAVRFETGSIDFKTAAPAAADDDALDDFDDGDDFDDVDDFVDFEEGET